MKNKIVSGMYRIHITGCSPRSGTTLMTELMIACFKIDQYTSHEDFIDTWPKYNSRIFLTKAPADTRVIDAYLRCMPRLYVIYMLRDPRDVIVSRHGMQPDQYWCDLYLWKRLANIGKGLNKHPRFITIRYEDLVSNPGKVQEYLAERLPFLVQNKDFSDFHLLTSPSEKSLDALNGIRPINMERIGNWKNHLPRVAGQLKLYGSISDDLIEMGYENNTDWEKLLQGVKPDLTPGHLASNKRKRKIKSIFYIHGKYIKALWTQFGHLRPVITFRNFWLRSAN